MNINSLKDFNKIIEYEDFKIILKNFGKSKKNIEQISICFYYILLNKFKYIKSSNKYNKKYMKYKTRISEIIFCESNDYSKYLLSKNEYIAKSFLIIINNINYFDLKERLFYVRILKELVSFSNIKEESYFISNLNTNILKKDFFKELISEIKINNYDVIHFHFLKIFINSSEFYPYFMNFELINNLFAKLKTFDNDCSIIIEELIIILFKPKLNSNKRVFKYFINNNKINIINFLIRIFKIENYLIKRTMLNKFLKIIKINEEILNITIDSTEILKELMNNLNCNYNCLRIVFLNYVELFINNNSSILAKRIIKRNIEGFLIIINSLLNDKNQKENKNFLTELTDKLKN